MAGGLARLGGGILKGAWNLVKGRPLLTGAAAFGYAAYHEEVNEAVANAWKNPGETFDSAKETVSGGVNAFEGAAKDTRHFFEDAADTAGNLKDLADDPVGTITGGGDGEGFDIWNIAKWGAGIGIGGWLLSKVFGGNDNNNDSNNDNGFGFGGILKMGLMAMGGFLLWSNRQEIGNALGIGGGDEYDLADDDYNTSLDIG